MSSSPPSPTALKTNQLLFEEKPLHVPALEELREVISNTLKKNFLHVSVEVSACPDLTGSTYGLMEAGLCGSPTLLEVGGPPYLLPLVDRSKVYNIPDIARKCFGSVSESSVKSSEDGRILAVGAGAGPHPLRHTNCEGIYNMSIPLHEDQGEDSDDADDDDDDEDQAKDKNKKDKVGLRNGSYTAKVSGSEEVCVLERIPDSEPRCALLLNLFLCRGLPGNVLKVSCRLRTGPQNFVECIRKGLETHYGDKCVGLGGLFVLRRGRAHQHVMRDFSTTPLHTEEDLNKWLKFYDMPAQLHAVGTLITHEMDLDLRLQHFHSFSRSNWGGHYHYDTTPEVAEYEAYFNVAERVVRVDKPLQTHKVGRD